MKLTDELLTQIFGEPAIVHNKPKWTSWLFNGNELSITYNRHGEHYQVEFIDGVWYGVDDLESIFTAIYHGGVYIGSREGVRAVQREVARVIGVKLDDNEST